MSSTQLSVYHLSFLLTSLLLTASVFQTPAIINHLRFALPVGCGQRRFRKISATRSFRKTLSHKFSKRLFFFACTVVYSPTTVLSYTGHERLVEPAKTALKPLTNTPERTPQACRRNCPEITSRFVYQPLCVSTRFSRQPDANAFRRILMRQPDANAFRLIVQLIS